LTLALAGGCTSCPGGALTHFSCKLGLKKIFSPGGAGAPTAPPGYAYETLLLLVVFGLRASTCLSALSCVSDVVMHIVARFVYEVIKWVIIIIIIYGQIVI